MTARFKVGACIRVRRGITSGHRRTPGYIQGKTGTIAAIWGTFPNPESRAYGGDGLPEQVLYLVSFNQNHVWEQYKAPLKDKLFIDIFEHWLKPA